MSRLFIKKTLFLFVNFVLIACLSSISSTTFARKRRAPAGGRIAIVVDERLAALRDEPGLTALLLQRMSRGRMVAVTGARRTPDGLTFYRVAVTTRTQGWLQSEAVVSPARAGDDERLLRLIRGSEEFDRIARARIFLDNFPKSPLRPAVLLLYGDAAEEAAVKLSRAADRQLDEGEMKAGGAPARSYFLNYHGLDRYRRQGIIFIFDDAKKQYHYDGESWREIVHHYSRSAETIEARKRLASLDTNRTTAR